MQYLFMVCFIGLWAGLSAAGLVDLEKLNGKEKGEERHDGAIVSDTYHI